MSDGRNLLTHSRTQCMRTCLRKHWFAYELGLRKDVKSAPLRIGSSIHKAKELVGKGMPVDDAILAALKPYETVPAWADAFEWSIEREKVFRLAWAYFQYWGSESREIVAAEQAFELPIRNPETGGTTRSFLCAGKIDGIVQLPDGRTAVEETKTTSKDISAESDYWQRLRIDDQITRYFYAAQALGHKIQAVIYDVIRKPSIQPKQVPLTDSNGDKIVLNADGTRAVKSNGQPYLTGNAEKGMTLQTRLETAQEYGDRLSEDIAARPEFYLARREIVRLESDIMEWEAEQWQQQQLLRECQRTGRWFRNPGACLSPYRCEYADVCFSGWTPNDPVPAGFKIVDNVNPELEEEGE